MPPKQASPESLQAELDAARQRIALLEKQLATVLETTDHSQMDTHHHPACRFRPDLHLIYANAQLSEATGLPAENLAERSVLDLFPGSLPVDLAERLAGLRPDNPSLMIDTALVAGKAHLWLIVAHFDVQGALLHYDAALHDISLQAGLIERLESSEARYRAIIDSMTQALYVHSWPTERDPGQLIEVNARACEMLGYTRDRLLGMNFREIDDPASDVDAEAVIRRLAEGETVTFQQRHRTRDGRILPVEIHARRVLLDGQPVIVSLAQDIAARLAAESTRRMLEAAMQQAEEAVLITEPINDEGEVMVRYANRAFTHMTGLAVEDILYRPMSELSSQPGYVDAAERFEIDLASLRPFKGQITARRPDGSPLSLNWTTTPIRDSSGAVLQYVTLIHDTTVQSEQAGALDEMSRFLAGAIDSIDSSIAVLAPDGEILRVNAGWERFGRENSKPGQALYTEGNYLAFCDSVTGTAALDAQAAVRAIRDVISGKRDSAYIEYPCHSPTQRRWFGMRVTPFDEPTPRRVVVAHHNITERILATEELRRQTTILHQSRDLIALADLDGRLIFMNQGGADLLGYEGPEQLIGHRLTETHPPEAARRTVEEYIPQALQRGHWQGENVMLTLLGEQIAVEQSILPIREIDGRVQYIATVISGISERKRMENALRASEELYRSLIESTDAAVILLDRQGRYLFVNKVTARPFGRTPDSIIGLNIRDLFSAEECDTIQADIDQVIRSGEGLVKETSVLLKGERHWFNSSMQPVRNAAGEVQSVLISTVDISATRKAEQALRESERLTQALFNHLPGAVFVKNAAGQILHCNQAYADLMGRPIEQIRGTTGHAALPPQSATLFSAQDAEVLASGHPIEYFEPLAGRHWHTVKFPIEREGEPPLLGGVALDVTRAHRAEEALRASEARYRQLVEAASVAIFVNRAGRIEYANPACLALLGADSSEQLLNKSPFDIFHPDYHERIRQRIQTLTDQKQSVPLLHEQIVRMDGSVRDVEVTAAPFSDEQGEAIQVMLVDVTERMKAENALRASETRYRQMFEEHSLPKVILDVATLRVSAANPAAQRFYGYSEEAFAGLTMMDINGLSEEQSRRYLKEYADGSVKVRQLKHRLASGEWREVEVYTAPIEVDGRTQIYAIVVDVNERLRAEAALKESESRYRQMFELHGIPKLLVDPATLKIVDANPASQRFHGYSHEQITSMSIDQINIIERGPLLEMATRAAQGTSAFQFRHRLASGEIRDVEVFSGPIEMQGRQVLYSIIIDITERLRAERAAQEAEQRYRALFDRANDAVFVIDFDGHFIDANQRAAELFGFEKGSDLIGHNRLEFVPPDEEQDSINRLEMLLRGEMPPLYERSFMRRDGKRVLTEISISLVYDAEDKPQYIQSIIRDISERKRTEQAIRESEGRYRALFERANDAVLLLDAQGRHVAANPRAVEIFGYDSVEEILALPPLGLVDPSERGETTRRLQTLSSSGQLPIAERIFVRKDGGRFPGEVSSAVISDASGQPRYFQNVIRDISERKRAEQIIRESEERYRQLVDQSPYGIAIHQDGRLAYANPAAARLMGYANPAAMIGLAVAEMVHPDFRVEGAALTQRVLDGEIERHSHESHWLRADGSDIYVESTLTLFSYHGRPAIQVIAVDITERKRAEAALRESEERFRAFFEVGLVGLALTSPEKGWIMINDQLCEILGYSREELLPLSWDRITYPEDLETDVAQFNRILAGESNAYVLDKRFIRKDGSITHCHIGVRVVRRPDGSVDHFLAMVQDINQRKQLEATLREREENFRMLVENQTDLLIKVDEQNRIAYVSQTYCEMFEKHPSDLIGKPFMEAIYQIHPADQENTARMLDSLFNPPYMGAIEHRALTPRGWRWLGWVDKAVVGPDGKVQAIIAVGRDVTERKTADLLLRASEERLSLALRGAGAGLFEWRQQDNSTLWSDENFRILGYQPGAVTPNLESWLEAIHPEDRERAAEEKRGAILASSSVSSEYRVVWPDGSIHWVQDIGQASEDAEGQRRLIGITLDIDQRKAAEAVLRDSRDELERRVLERTAELNRLNTRLETIFANSGDAIVLLDLVYGIQQVNPAFDRLLGSEPDRYTHKPIESIAHPEDLELVQAAIQLTALARETRRLEMRARRADGADVYLEMTISPVSLVLAETTHLICILRDTTERRRAEHAIAEERNLLRTLVDAIPDFVYVKDTEGRILLHNIAHARSVGASTTSEVLGKRDSELFPPELAHSFIADEEELLRTGQPLINREEPSLGEDGRPIWATTTKVPLRNLKGELIGMVGITHDITDLKAGEAALRRSQEQLRESRQMLQNVLDTIPVRVFWKDRHSIYQGCNRRFAEDAGLRSGEEIAGKRDEDLPWLPEESAQYVAADQMIINGEVELLEMEEVQHFDKGRTATVQTFKQPLRDAGGQVIGVLGAYIDITARKEAEAALELKHREEKLMQQRLAALHQISLELTRMPDLDSFYRRVVELARQELGFDRFALFLYDEDRQKAIGTYGTSDKGRVISERRLHFSPEDFSGLLKRTMQREQRISAQENVMLYAKGREAGRGWNLVASLWHGEELLGWLVADNALRQEPLTQVQIDTLNLYSSSIAEMLVRIRAELALRQSEERYRTVVDAMSEGVMLQDERSRVIACNPAAERILGQPVQELLGRRTMDLGWRATHEDGSPFPGENFPSARAIRSGQPQKDAIMGILRPDGSRAWVSINSQPIFTAGAEKAHGAVTTFADVTALRALAQRLELATSSARLGIWDWNVKEHSLLWDDRMRALYGLPPGFEITEEYLSKRLIHPDDLEEAWQVTSKTLKDQSIYDTQFRIVTPTGEVRHIKANGIVLRDENGESERLIGVNWDMTAIKQAEENLREALLKEKEVGELRARFISTASHEFRTPLATIMATVDTLDAYGDRLDREQIQKRLAKIRTQINHMKLILEDVLTLSRMQTRYMEFRPSEGDLDELIQEIVEEFQSRPIRDVSFDYQCDVRPFAVSFDSKLMRQVINNLISNAIKYSPSGGVIEIRLSQEGNRVLFSIHDEGIGIPEDDLKHLFEPFHRASNVGAISGTGLGLAITRQSVELHGGSIRVETAVNRGATFKVNLPITPPGSSESR